MTEKRRFLRIPLAVPVQFKKIGALSEDHNLSKDISVRGIRFLSQHFVAVDSYIKMQVEARENHEPAKFIAKVAWIKSIYEDELFEIGAEICEITKEDSDFLGEIVSF